MAEFSRWHPAGGYDYFEAPGFLVPLGDDLPDPSLPRATKLGVPSGEVGRAMPAMAMASGSGDSARGTIVPMNTSRLGQLMSTDGSPVLWLAVGAGVVGTAWWLSRRR